MFMGWSSIIGQERVKNILQRAILEQRVAHAYLLWGTAGIGKDALALEFAKTMNCEEPRQSADSIEACDSCRSCRQAQSLQHHNIRLLYPLPSGKGEDSKSSAPIAKLSEDQLNMIQDQLRQKAENPYYDLDIQGASQIRIASIRELNKVVSLASSRSGRRFIIVFDAERMNQEAANAFLKTLEEPSANVTIILTTARRDKLLATIRSRCQQIQCNVLSDSDIAQALVARDDVEPANARLVARLADGSYTRAGELMNDDLHNLRREVVSLFRSILKQRRYILALHSQIESISADKNRQRVEQMLTLLLLWLRDAYALSVSRNHDVIINIDQIRDIESFVKNFAGADLPSASKHVEEAIQMLRQNVQIPLMLIRLALELRAILLRPRGKALKPV